LVLRPQITKQYIMENYEVPKDENLDELLNDPQVWEEAKKAEAEGPDGKSAAKLAMAGFARAATDPSEIQKTMALANDPEAMAQAQRLMQDPDFKAEMNQILHKPEFQQAMERAKNMFTDLMGDPEKVAQLQEMMANPEKMQEMQQQYASMFGGVPPGAEAAPISDAPAKKKKTRRGGKKHKKKGQQTEEGEEAAEGAEAAETST